MQSLWKKNAAYIVEGLLKHQHRARGSQDQQGLATEQAEDDPKQAGGQQGLTHSHQLVCLLT